MVDWKKLGEICGVLRGKRLTKKELTDSGKYPVFHGGVLPIGYYNEYNREGDMVMIINVGASAGTVGYYKNEFWSSDGCFCIEKSSMINNRYLFYFLQSRTRDIQNKVRYAGIPTLDASAVGNIVIPIPSLFEQQHIVKTLDTFTASIDNLKEQITQRRKQYEHYRDQLFLFQGRKNVEWKKIEEVCELKRGVRVVKKDLQEKGQIPVYQNSLTPLGYFEKSNYPKNTSFVICAGAAGEVGFSNKDFWAADDCTCIVCTPEIISKYVYYYLLVKQHLLKSQVRKASVPRLSKDVIGKITVAIPSLDEQSRIVSILDSFEAGIANLEEQLALRQKQYEYYREKLLTFE